MRKVKKTESLPLLVLSVYILLVLTRIIPQQAFGNTVAIFAAMVILEVMVFALPSFTYCRLFALNYVDELKIRLPSVRACLQSAIFCAVIIFGSLSINSLVYLTGFLDEELFMIGPSVLANEHVHTQFLYVFFAYALIPAVCEEFLFRGILLSGYAGCLHVQKKTQALLFPSILSSLLYAMAGLDFSSFLSRFFTGMMLCFAVLFTGGLLCAFIIRFACGLLSVYFIPALRNMVTQPLTRAFAFLFIPVAFLISLFFLLLVLEREYKKRAYDPAYAHSATASYSTDGNYSFANAVLSVFFIICIVFFVVSGTLGIVL